MDEDKPAIFRATYRNFKNVPSRGFVQLIFEVPVEQYDAAYQVLGVPHPGKESWFAIARLNESLVRVDSPPQIEAQPVQALPSSSETTDETPDSTPSQHKEKRTWFDMPAAGRASMRCADHRFWTWLHDIGRIDESAEVPTLEYVRRISGGSRSNLGKNGFERETEAWDIVDHAYAKYLERKLIDSMR
jgi:hypothetical protein